MRHLRQRRKGGYLLIEAIIATIIVSLGVLACYAMITSADRISKQSDLRAAAYAVAREKLATLLHLRSGKSNFTSTSTFSIPQDILNAYPGANFQGTFSNSPFSQPDSATLRQVVVRVSWDRPGAIGTSRSAVQLQTVDFGT